MPCVAVQSVGLFSAQHIGINASAVQMESLEGLEGMLTSGDPWGGMHNFVEL